MKTKRGLSIDMVSGEHYAGGKSIMWHIAAVGDWRSDLCSTWSEAVEQVKEKMK